MPLVTVLTAAAPSREALLSRAFQSVVSQELPAGWSLEWVVQYDGERGKLPEVLLNDGRISYASNGQQAGTAITRNLGLARARGNYIRVLDDDDELLEGALRQDIEVLTSASEIWWTTSRAIDMYPDGREFIPDDVIAPGKIHVGGLFDLWLSSNGIPPIHPATLCAKTEVVRALGGWMALPVSDDVGLLMAMSSLFPGYFATEPSLQYNKSDFQITASEYSKSRESKTQRIDAIRQRVESMCSLSQNFVAFRSN